MTAAITSFAIDKMVSSIINYIIPNITNLYSSHKSLNDLSDINDSKFPCMLETVETLIADTKMKKQDNKTIQSCIHRLELTIKNIHNVLNEINDISIKYTTSYWKYFTNPYLYDKNGVYLIDKLKKYRIQLKDEFDMFYKILLLKDF